MSSIFISHSSQDNDFCEKLIAWLSKQEHHSIFLDFDRSSGIAAGQNWEHKIYRELRSCSAVVAVCSPHFLSSKWCFAEITHARSLGKPVLPLLIEKCDIASIFSDTQVIDFSKYKEQDAFERLKIGLYEAGIDIKDVHNWDNTRPPYPGLLAFQEEDAAVFFGRNTKIDEVLSNLKQIYQFNGSDMVMVLGASGCGKSSLVRAGVIPRLKRDTERWLVLDPIKPSENPFKELAKSLKKAFGFHTEKVIELEEIYQRLLTFSDELEKSSDGKIPEMELNPLESLLENSDRENAKLVLVIDQFEELLNRSFGHHGSKFLVFLKGFLGGKEGRVIVLATMRSDFLGIYQENTSAYQNFKEVRLGPIDTASLSEIIKEPAEIAGIIIESKLLQVLINDAKGEGTLPLLAFTMRELYDRYANDNLIKYREYEELGGIQGSIGKTAEEVFRGAELSKEKKEILRRAFFDMTRINEEGNFTRNRVPWSDIPHEIHEVLENLVKARLLVSDREEEETMNGETTVEVAHESLFKSWKQLNTWLDEEREFFLWRRRLDNQIEEWEHNSRDKSALLYGNVLNEGKKWYEVYDDNLNDTQKLFLDESLKEAASYKRKWQLRNTAIIAVLVAAFASVIYLYLNASNEKNKAQANYLISEANKLAETDATLAIHLAGKANGKLPNDSVIIRDTRNIFFKHGFYKAEFKGSSAFFSPNGKRVLTTLLDGTAQLWNLEGNPIGSPMGPSNNLRPANFSPDGKQVLTVSDSTARIWDVKGNPIGEAMQHSDWIRSAIFSRDDKYILTASRDSTARLWDLKGNSIGKAMKHSDAVRSAIFSPDDQLVLTASTDGTARLWDLKGNPIGKAMKHSDAVRSAIFSPDGQWVLTVSNNRKAKLWDLGGKPIGKVMEHSSTVLSAIFSPDSKQVLTTSLDGTTRLWDIEGSPIGRVMEHSEILFSPIFSPDGQQILTATRKGTVHLWDIKESSLDKAISHSSRISTATFSPEGDLVLTATWNGTVHLWDIKGRSLGKIMRHSSRISTATFSPDGNMVLTASKNGTARVWNLEGNIRERKLSPTGQVTLANFSPDGKNILTVSQDSIVQLWDLKGKPMGRSMKHPFKVYTAFFSSDGEKILAVSKDSTAQLWDLQGYSASSAMIHSDRIISAIFSPTGEHILTTSLDGNAQVWDNKGNPLGGTMSHANIQNSAIFSPNGEQVLTLYMHTARLWDIEGNPMGGPMEHSSRLTSANFSQDGRRVLTASDSTARLWDLKGNPIGKAMKHSDAVRSAIFSPDGKRVLTASMDGTACLWDLKGNPIGKAMKHSDAVRSAIFSPDGKRVLTKSLLTVRLWDLEGNPMGSPIEHSSRISSIVFSPTGRQVLTASWRIAWLWDLEGNPVGNPMEHNSEVISAIFSPDGKHILTTSMDSKAQLWDLKGNPIDRSMEHHFGVNFATLSPDSKQILTISGDSIAWLWDVVLLEDFLKSEHLAPLTEKQKERYNIDN